MKKISKVQIVGNGRDRRKSRIDIPLRSGDRSLQRLIKPKRGIWGGVSAVLVLLALCTPVVLEWWWTPRPPAGSRDRALRDLTPAENPDGLRRLNDCYAFRREQIQACWLRGQPEIRGVALARFLQPELEAVEIALEGMLRERIPNSALRWAFYRRLIFRQRHLGAALPEAIRREVAGMTGVRGAKFSARGSAYARGLQALSLYDRAQGLDARSRVSGLAWGVTAKRTRDGTPLLAHCLEFPGAEKIDQHKVVMVVQPLKGQKFLSVTWPGMWGVLAGLNESGLGVGCLPAQTQTRAAGGLPVSVLARKILTEAKTLQQAVAIARAFPIGVSQSLLIGSGQEDRFVVVEKSPDRTVVRQMQNGLILASNHLIASPLREDPENQEVRSQGPSLARYRRLKELIMQNGRAMTPRSTVKIMRDRRGEFGVPLGLGHRAAINSLTAVQTVVFDLKNQVTWVSNPPHQLGKFVAFDLNNFAEPPDPANLPADPLLKSGKYNEYLVYEHGRGEAEELLASGEYREALAWLQEVGHFNPLDYRAYFLAGQALQSLARRDEAKYNFRRARDLHPAWRGEKLEIELRLREPEPARGAR